MLWAATVSAAVALTAIGLERTLFFVSSPEPLLVERLRVGTLVLQAGTAASVISALWSHRRRHPIWVTAGVSAPAVAGGLFFLMPLTLIPQAAGLLALPAALTGLLGGLIGRRRAGTARSGARTG